MQIWKEVGCLYLAPAGGPKPFAFCAIKIKIQPLQKRRNIQIKIFLLSHLQMKYFPRHGEMIPRTVKPQGSEDSIQNQSDNGRNKINVYLVYNVYRNKNPFFHVTLF